MEQSLAHPASELQRLGEFSRRRGARQEVQERRAEVGEDRFVVHRGRAWFSQIKTPRC